MVPKTVSAAAPPGKAISLQLGPLSNSALAKMNDEQLRDDLERTSRAREALAGRTSQLAAEIARRQAFRAKGATSIESYLVGQLGISRAAARALAVVGEKLSDLPELQASLSAGDLSFDKVRVVADVADPETDAEWAETAAQLSIGDLAEVVHRSKAKKDPRSSRGRGPERPTLRRNDACLTLTARLPKIDYAEVCARLEAQADSVGADGESPYDERLADALLSLLREERPGRVASLPRKGSQYLVVAHVALSSLLGHGADGRLNERGDRPGVQDGQLLAAELERAGLISLEVARRLACDASLVIGLDDEAGHTMYEGRVRRFPTETQRRELWRRDRHCRFPGCSHVQFVQAHHVEPWKPGGRTDLHNLVVLCTHHHHLVHSNNWSMSGNANEELTFVGPDGRPMRSSPSTLWGSIGADSERGAKGTRGVQRVDRESG